MTQISSLQQREEEYRRLNEQMEQKTAVLMQEAEQMLRKHEALLDDKTDRTISAHEGDRATNKSGLSKEKAEVPLLNVDLEEEEDFLQTGTKIHRRILLSATERAKPDSEEKKVTSQPVSAVTTSERKSAPLTRHNNLQNNINEEENGEDFSDVIPATAHQMGAEAQLRFFKAKVRVLQEELDRSQHELAIRSREADSINTKFQEATEDRNRFTRQVASLQQALTKQKKLADDNESRATALERSIEAVRREAESAKRENKKATSDKSAHEVRLNRAVEEAEHLRQELAKTRASAREANSDETRKIEKLMGEVRRLERQRTELIAAFKKSLKLIDVLKRQKLHLEAARLLQFREEDFVRALDWDKQTTVQVSNPHSLSAGSLRNKSMVSSKRTPASSGRTTSSAIQQATKQKPLNALVEDIVEIGAADDEFIEENDDADY